MPFKKLSRFFLLPELNLLAIEGTGSAHAVYKAVKESKFEVCPKCATKSLDVHDRRWVDIKDAPIRGKFVTLRLLKRRFRCPKCKSVFTEPVPGIKKWGRVTQRFKTSILWSCETFSDLKKVARFHNCGSKTVYSCLYEKLRLKQKEQNNQVWSKTVGIDEHSFNRNKKLGRREFVTCFVDYNNKKMRECVLGRSGGELLEGIKHIPGRENVKNVVMDMSSSYRSFVKGYFPQAIIIADKFHVLRLFTPLINIKRKAITGDVRTNPIRRLLLCNGPNLDYFKRKAMLAWLDEHPELREIYHYKEWLHRVYRCKGYRRARMSLIKLLDTMALSKLPEVKSLRATLLKWQKEILNYFESRLTNARTEGFNNVAKLVQKRGYGYKSFENYRLRLLYACSGRG
jgi:transposase